MNQNEFEQHLLELGIKLTEKQKDQLEKFYQILKEKNKQINLTRIIEKEEVYLKHFYDSLTIVKVVDFSKIHTLCDVGTGAGFPGVVLKIVFPHLEVTLLDKLQKRIFYLQELIKELKLEKIEAKHIRGEDYHEKKFDLVTTRAVASLEKLLPICMPLLTSNGLFVAMKANVEEELARSNSLCKRKKFELKQKVEFRLPKENSKRTLLLFQK